ncbi:MULTISPECIES: DNA-binding domain-containing protein [Tissierellales]|uniref:Response regulator n=1 Tax=Acidilutibacter cellobiosedens TaxID=2507161 RepID=A0A410QF12_9FIRM|nr:MULTISPECIES: DNA-binding domain-containing protein [Tissierellales]MBE6082621.1 response regulator [Tissierellaceae bacterium]QAT62499.1 response regulator [Acidilutibacter cellobiosedens]SCL88839.1 Stage 0 sporulation protein A [Sporanaerobacter sp. PP17-6a]
MKYYIVDDDINIVKILANIIEENNLGEVVGSSNDGDTALKEIIIINPDIVLVDLLMPKLDGNSLVKEIKKIKPEINFIMISQVSDTDLITEAYNLGIEFFINKPINIIEVEKVANKVAQKIELERMLKRIKRVFKDSDSHEETERENKINKIKNALSMVGMLGEKGTSDIIKICMYIIESEKSYEDFNLDNLCSYISKDKPKTVKQRIRRAIKIGLSNIASEGLEDYSNEIFQTYFNTLFDFENVKAEMDFLRGKRNIGGKVNIDKFFEGLLFLCEKPY